MTESEPVEQVYARLRANANPWKINGKEHYVVEGDLLLSEIQLRAYAARIVDLDTPREPLPGVKKEPLLGMVDDTGRIIRWRKGLLLTYKVMRSTFPTPDSYERVVLGMRRATAAWQGNCGINFKHLNNLDDGSPETTEKAVFRVEYGDSGGQFIALAFFPNEPVERRVIFIDPSYFQPNLSFEPIGVLRHELGHVLGFRHEHIRGGAPANCKKNESLEGVLEITPYDSKSVMHYLCGGVGDPQLVITEWDRLGAREIYGPPDQEVTYYE
jgi:hypothetical protein